MSIDRNEVLRVANLVELGVSDEEVERLVQDIGNIVDYVSQLAELPAGDEGPSFLPGPAQVELRDDVVAPIPLARSPAEMAPEFIDGFFVVPRLEAMGE
jgi:aspartyl-tRNA(Asn)/glutamyl-tRNA(Gln) amidotransferase subunit C